MSVGPIVSLVCSSLDKETHFREKYSYKWEKGIWNIGMPCSSKAWFMPFYFCKRSILVSFSTNVKKSKEDFSSYKKKKGNAPFVYILLIYEISIGTLYCQRARETHAIFFSKKEANLWPPFSENSINLRKKPNIIE